MARVIDLIIDLHQPMNVVDNGDNSGRCFSVSAPSDRLGSIPARNPIHVDVTTLHALWNVIGPSRLLRNKSDIDLQVRLLGEEVSRRVGATIVSPDESVGLWAEDTHEVAVDEA